MPTDHSRSPARVLAPLALLVLGVAVALIVLGSGGSSDDSRKSAEETEGRTAATDRASRRSPPRKPATYTVKPGDSLGGIGQKTAVKVELLQELNPELDPQALVPGQKIKLRE
jgi:LysM repeat protein